MLIEDEKTSESVDESKNDTGHSSACDSTSSIKTNGERNAAPDSYNDQRSTVSSGFQSGSTSSADSGQRSFATILPWGVQKERLAYPFVDMDIRPGEYVMRTLFTDFTVQAERKMEAVMADLERPLSKVLQRGEDSQFDQLLTAFGSVAEHCLPSILRALLAWYERQMSPPEVFSGEAKKSDKVDSKGKSGENSEVKEVDVVLERRDLAVEFIFCLVLIEVLRQLPFHPGHEDLISYIENLAFKHFKYREGSQNSPNADNIHMVADLYAEVTGALAQSRFPSVRKKFTAQLKELRSKEPSTHTSQSIVSLLMGMKFFRIKMVPIEEFEASFQFMQENAQYFLEVKDKDIKHALAGLFVEILVPVAATVKNEVNVPCLKNFVESLYSQTLDMCTKSKHRLALFPLVTCLLCVSQKTFFLQNWHYFLAMCLSHLKNRDPKISRVALESLYRLLWVYMIRIKCESNSATQSRLQSIVNSLFPKGSKAVVPRDTPLNIFVKIIQFIAQERLDFAMREIVFDLLSVGRPIKLILTPERMSIGLRAFLVVADSLQQKEGEPPMPRTSGALPSGSTLRVKKTFLNKMLTEDTARSIGMAPYFPHVRRVFVDILRALDVHYGRPLTMTSTQNVNKEPDEMITGERKPRIDLFRTCVAAVPRLIPDAMTGSELVDLLSRLTVHMDEELRALSYQSLQTLVIDFPDWRHDVILGFTQFLARDIQDTSPQLMDNGLRMLLQLLTSWKNALSPTTKGDTLRNSITSRPVDQPQITKDESLMNVFHNVQGFALVMLCNCRLCPRRLAIHVLREVKFLIKAVGCDKEQPVIDVIDKCCPQVLEKCLPYLPAAEKTAALSASVIDLQWIADRSSSIWTAGVQEENSSKSSSSFNLMSGGTDPWGICLFGFLERDRVLSQCPSVVTQAWPFVYSRLHSLFAVIDPTPVNDNRASILRSSAPPRKPVTERDLYLALWRYYAGFAMRVVPPAPSPVIRCASPDLSLRIMNFSGFGSLGRHESMSLQGFFIGESDEDFQHDPTALSCIPLHQTVSKARHRRTSSSPDSLTMAERGSGDKQTPTVSPAGLYKLIVPLLRCETTDVRDAAVLSLGKVNSDALKDLMEELVAYIREAVDRKQENMRRRRRRDALRLQLVQVFELIAEHGTFGTSICVLDRDTHSLHPTIVEYVDGARLCLEAESDKEALGDIKLHFCNFIRKMLKSFSLEICQTLLKRDLRRNLFLLFANWSGNWGRPLSSFMSSSMCTVGAASTSSLASNTQDVPSAKNEEELQFSALQAMCAVLCCGPCFDPQGLLSEDGSLYPWLDLLLASDNEKIRQLGEETVILLLECNPDMGSLLDWVVDRCYTAVPKVADSCFLSLATIFSTREYPCDHYTAIINVTLMNTGCPRTLVHETALQLLQILDKRFFGTVGLVPSENDTEDGERGTFRGGTLDLLLSTTSYCRSQLHLSQQLAQLHPELTMPMFSEITHRFQTARPEVRQLLLQYLLPWLHNMELVDPNVPPANPLSYYQYYAGDVGRGGCHREGWGSVEATEMVLNNLFYITAKLADQHPKEMEDVWATLCSCWPNNMKVIIRYFIIISGMAPTELLPFAKRVVLYLARARADRLLDELMTELQTVETLNCLIERTETPPFYRLTSMRKTSSHSDPGPGQNDIGSRNDLAVEKGTIHTKRHSGDDPGKGTVKSESAIRDFASGKFVPPRGADKIRTASGPAVLSEDNITTSNEPISTQPTASADTESSSKPNEKKYDIPQPHPLPMPEYGGYFAPLTEYLPTNIQPNSGFHRCNVAVMLLTDVVVDCLDLDWSIHIPLMLHILFLGLDHARVLVHEHCKQLLLNLLLVLADHSDHLSVAQILLNRKTAQLGLGLPAPTVDVLQANFTEPDSGFSKTYGTPASSSLAVISSSNNDLSSSFSKLTTVAITNTEPSECSKIDPDTPIQDITKSLIDFLAARKYQALWSYEDITAKMWTCRSVEQLETFLQYILRVFRESMPHALISERWAQTALQLGLSCSSRHYAGRSLQIFRALQVPITSRMLSDILSRLVETVAEQGEDMQGYVTELLLTLEAAVDSLESDFRPLDFMKEIFKSTPNLNNKEVVLSGKKPQGIEVTQNCGAIRVCPMPPHNPLVTGHMRSTSYSVSYCMRRGTGSPSSVDTKDLQSREIECRRGLAANKYTTNLCRSRSAQSLKLLGDSATQDDKMTILAQLFWLSLSLLESDYEHEFLLALRLLSRVLHRLPLDRPDARDKVDKLQAQLKWTSFPGVHALLLKGCTNPNTYEPVVTLLSQFTPLLDLHVVDPTQSIAFPMNVISLLPYMLLHYEDANELCVLSAENIAQVSTEKSKKLENLATVMTLYSRRTFSKESFQWTKCVVKYLYDTYAHLSFNMLAFLVEVLEKGPAAIQSHILSIIHCMLHYVDLASAAAQPFNADFLRVISKYIEGPHYKEALKILKLVVTRCSTLVAPPISSHHQYHWETHASAPHPSFTDMDVFTKKELPGRTMEFTFDLSQTPVIGRRAFSTSQDAAFKKTENTAISNSVTSPCRSSSLSPADNLSISGWKRPWMCQSRVRECLVNLLTTCGQRVGLPKSPSVIFSQTSDIIERQSSVASSTEEVSGPDLSGGSRHPDNTDHFGVFKDFDFLEYESESVEGESTDNFNWGVRRRPLSGGEGAMESDMKGFTEESVSENTPLLTIRKQVGLAPEESSDDDVGSESPLDEIHTVAEFSQTPAPPSSLSLSHRRDSATSGSSGGDLGDITPCNASPNISALLSFRPITRNDAEEIWRHHIHALINRAPSSSLQLFHLLYKLVKEVISKCVSTSREAVHLLADCSEVEGCNHLLGQLSSLTDNLAAHTEPPLVWFNPDSISNHITESLKFGMLELREHLDTLLDRKDYSAECIDTLKSIMKLQHLNDDSTISNYESVLDLGRALYKLHFQLLLLLESTNKMFSLLLSAIHDSQLQDISVDVISIKVALGKAQDEAMDLSDQGTPTPTPSPSPLPVSDHPEGTLLEFIQESKWNAALYFVRQNKGSWSFVSDLICSGIDDDDVVYTLNVYCYYLIQKRPDVFVMTEQDLSSVLNSLMEGLCKVLAAVNKVETFVKQQRQTVC
ncbi:unnamed protein product [Bemisia tabaci]|uniref:Furry n=1 Tax=Bemisia tabaci TaxID=7038 RepID=A0A9P0A4P0_BEMTA|nr:unnamed protein product [Bemisia tabaci]